MSLVQFFNAFVPAGPGVDGCCFGQGELVPAWWPPCCPAQAWGCPRPGAVAAVCVCVWGGGGSTTAPLAEGALMAAAWG